jgi:hypothetical protein
MVKKLLCIDFIWDNGQKEPNKSYKSDKSTRFRPYPRSRINLYTSLRLKFAMSFKNAIKKLAILPA